MDLFIIVVDYNLGTTVLRWFDNHSVKLISNYIGNSPGEPARCRDGKIIQDTRYTQIERPKLVEIYNTNLGSVDLCNMMLST